MAIDFPEIDPIAIAIGPLEIRWYALAYLTGFILGWKLCLFLSRKYYEKGRPNRTDVDEFLSWAVLGVILGGRLGYVLFYQFEYYWMHPLEALKIWQGGMSFHGGMLGVLVSMVLFSVVQKVSLLRLADMVCVVVPIGLFFGRIANFINGELFGRVSDAEWAVRFPRAGVFPRHPSQLYEAVLEGIVLFVILMMLYKREAIREKAGVVSGVFLIGYGAARSFVEQFREPDMHLGLLWDLITMGQLLSVPMMVIGFSVVVYALTHQVKDSKAA